MKKLTRALATIVTMGTIATAQAVPIQIDFAGQVDSATPTSNVFGLAAGDQIFGTAFIPDADLLGTQTYSPFDGSLQLSFEIGNVTFNESQDLGFADFPTLTIQDGQFLDLNFFVLDFEFIFNAFSGSWAATFFGTDAVEDLAGDFAAVPVPEPGGLGLFAVALLVIGWQLRRARAKA